MTVLAVGAQKGGVGKTTTALYMAAHAARRLGCTHGPPRVALVDRDESKNLRQLLGTYDGILPPGVVLLDDKRVPPPDAGYELVVIDTPPGVSALESLAEANLVLVPVLPEPQGVANLIDYLGNLDNQGRSVSPSMRILALMPNMVAGRTKLHAQHLEMIRQIAAMHVPPLAVLSCVRRLNEIANYNLAARDFAVVAEELFRYVLPHSHPHTVA